MEEELTETKDNMDASLERNLVLEREQIQAKSELEKALKWTTPLQGQTSSKKGLEYHY